MKCYVWQSVWLKYRDWIPFQLEKIHLSCANFCFVFYNTFISQKLRFRGEFLFFLVKAADISTHINVWRSIIIIIFCLDGFVKKMILLFERSNQNQNRTRQCDAFYFVVQSNPRGGFDGYCQNGIVLVREIWATQIRIQISTELKKKIKSEILRLFERLPGIWWCNQK